LLAIEGSKSRSANGRAKSVELKMQKAVKQEESQNLLQFVEFMERILKRCKRRTGKISFEYWKMRPVYIQTLLYADGTVMWQVTRGNGKEG